MPQLRRCLASDARRFAKLVRSVLVLVVLVSLAACAMRPLPPEKARDYKRIGVLSAMGDRFSLKVVGTTVFGNKEQVKEYDIGADDLATQALAQTLSKNYVVVELSRYRKAFMDQPKYWPGNKGVFDEDRPSVQEVIRKLMDQENLDAYLLLTPAYARVGSTNQSVAGIGIVKASRLFRSTYHRFHVAYVISVVDGKDFSLVADMRADPFDKRELLSFDSAPRVNSPSIEVPAAYIEAPEKYKAELRNKFENLMNRSIPETLRRANLLQ